MKYVQATKPEKHNGGPFFEHEIHIDLPYRDYSLERTIREFMAESADQKHTDFRISKRNRYEPWGEGEKPSPWSPKLKGVSTIVVRFTDRNKAMLFKLSFNA